MFSSGRTVTGGRGTLSKSKVLSSYLGITDDSVPGLDLGDQKEIVALGAYFHLERMDTGCVWIGAQVGRRWLHINFYAPRKGVVVMKISEEDHEPLLEPVVITGTSQSLGPEADHSGA
jgi:hypothetical protein